MVAIMTGGKEKNPNHAIIRNEDLLFGQQPGMGAKCGAKMVYQNQK